MASLKILIAEDELLIAKVMRLQFEKQGFRVENVTDANEAFEIALTMLPDIIILDILLKNKTTGLEAGRRIREAGILSPIIFTTGNSYDQTIELIHNISHAVVLTKPVEFEKLLEIINKFSADGRVE